MTEILNVLTAVVLVTDPSAVEMTLNGFAALGFEATADAPEALTITGEADLFTNVFNAGLVLDGDAPRVMGVDGSSYVLPADALSGDLGANVRAVEFEAPPDFGPTDY